MAKHHTTEPGYIAERHCNDIDNDPRRPTPRS